MADPVRIAAALRRAGYPQHARGLAARLRQHGTCVDVRGPDATVRVRLAADDREGRAGAYVAEVLGRGIVATEDGPCRTPAPARPEGASRVRSVRIPDDLWSRMERAGAPSDVIREAVTDWLRAHGR